MNKESSLETILRIMEKYAYSNGNIDIRSDKFKIGVFELLDMLDVKTWELKRKIEILEEKNMFLEEIIGKSNFASLLKGANNDSD